tara:strand:- start:1875 stop:2066 length:192 start_codon:yes stop_codon:yes gene_type:complete
MINIEKLENTMSNNPTKQVVFDAYAQCETTNERLQFVSVMKDFYPNVFDINWVSIEETVMNEA